MVSIECLQKAWATPTKTPYEKLVLVRLADRANGDNACWPGVTSLVKECCLSDRTVRRALKGLADSGLIKVKETGGGAKSNTYVLDLPDSPPVTVAPGSNRHRGPIDPTVQPTPEGGPIDPRPGSNGQGTGVYWTPKPKGTHIELSENPHLSTEEGEVKKKGKKSSGVYHPDARTVLNFLNEATGMHYREVDSNLTVISQRLKESGVTLEGVKSMILRQCKRWKGTEREIYLRPETLFRASKFDGYYAARELDLPLNGHKPARNNEIDEVINVPTL